MSGFLKAMVEFMAIMMTRFQLVARFWLLTLAAVNMTSLYFIDTMEARVVFGVFMISMMIMTGIYHRSGFIRILGVGHVLWIPMVLWLWARLSQTLPLNSIFEYWLLIVIVMNTISLVIDTFDVVRYIKGDRKPYYNLDKNIVDKS
jgi:hypothetical protein